MAGPSTPFAAKYATKTTFRTTGRLGCESQLQARGPVNTTEISAQDASFAGFEEWWARDTEILRATRDNEIGQAGVSPPGSTESQIDTSGVINNGVSRNESKEASLQAAIYCGALSALRSFGIASKVFGEVEI